MQTIQKRHPAIENTAERPRKHYCVESAAREEIVHAERSETSPASTEESAAVKEEDLYSLSADFLFSELNIQADASTEKSLKIRLARREQMAPS